MRLILLLLIALSFSHSGFGQFRLKDTTLNLNTGGEILDVLYLSTQNKYLIVGNFTSVNGAARNNIALLNEDFVLESTTNAVFPAFNGRINCVEKSTVNGICVGGDFTTVGGIAHAGLVRLSITNPSFGVYSFNLQTWDPFPDGDAKVHDLELSGGTMIAAGEFYSYTSQGVDYDRYCIAAFTASNGNINQTMFNEDNGIIQIGERYSGSGIITHLTVKKTIDGFALTGASMCTLLNCSGDNHDKLFLVTYNTAGVLTTGNPSPNFIRPSYDGNYLANAMDLQPYDATRLLTTVFSFQTHSIWGFNTSTYSAYPFLYRTNNVVDLDGFYPKSLDFHDVEMYQGNIYSVAGLGSTEFLRKDSASFQVINYSGGTYYTLNMIDQMPVATSTDQGPVSGNARGLKIVGNHLFLSSPGLTAVNGTARSRFAVVCLEPENAQPMNNLYNMGSIPPAPQPFQLDTVVCSGNIKKFTVPPSDYADGYKWTFIGPGVKYYIPATSTEVPAAAQFSEPLNGSAPSDLNNAHIIWLKFEESFVGGTLKVQPYMHCNSDADTLFSKPTQVSLTAAPLPNLQLAADSLQFSCLVDTLALSVSSSTPGATYQWFYNGTPQSTQANHLLPQTTFSNGFVYVSVTEPSTAPANGCVKRDSVHISVNTVYPEAVSVSQPLIWACSTDSMVITVSDTNSLAPEAAVVSFLENGSYTGSNPYTIYNELTNPSFIIYYPSNGCVDTSSVILSTDNDYTTAIVSGYPQGTVSLGTLDCNTNAATYSLEGFPAGSNGLNYWIYDGDTIQDDVLLAVTDSPLAQDTLELLYYSVNPDNGCVSPNQPAAVIINTQLPFVDDFTGETTLTCSDDSLILSHTPTAVASAQGWLVNDVSNSSPDLTVYGDGEYVYEVEGDNGCKSYDTVIVDQTNELIVNGMPDFYVCPGEAFSVTAQAQGNGAFSYSWENNLGIGNTGTGGGETAFYVTATNTDGCEGRDTVNVLITAPIEATFIGYSSCGSGGYIQVDTVSGGAVANNSQYTYSFNNGPVTTTNSFPVTEFAEYPFSVFDTMQCEYQFLTSITGELQQPDMDFLVSTYNATGDTIIIVNTSGFQGFAGYEWSSDGNVEFINTTDLTALVTASDSGWYNLVFTGYLLDSISNPGETDTCYYVFSKPVYFGNIEVNYQDSVTDYGISELVVYPNPNSIASLQPVNVSFTMGKAQNVYCVVLTQLGEHLPGMSYSGTNEANVSFTLNFPSGTAGGNYYLHIITEHDAAQVKLILQ